MLRRLPGVGIPGFKNTRGMAAKKLPVPETVVLPVSMHIGAPAKPVVKPGDHVKVGQVVAEPGGGISSTIHASVSGTVKKIEDIVLSGGQLSPAVFIDSDGLQEVYEGVKPPEVSDRASFISAVKDSGIVGLGGAGFPTYVKLNVKEGQVQELIINGAECEPFITSDTRMMLDDYRHILRGIDLLDKYINPQRIIFGIEKNKADCIKLYREKLKDFSKASVAPLPEAYPQGGEKVMIFNTTGKIVPEGKLPLDVGVVVINCTTVASIARYIDTGMPLVKKTVTVDGSAVKNPCNVIAPVGTPVEKLFDFCGGFKKEPAKILYGGPMMGIAVPGLDAPVLKSTNAVLALDREDAELPESTNCIRCGRCSKICPLNLVPGDIEDAYLKKDYEKLGQLDVSLCMECGSCSYICPARRPLTQTNKLAKAALRKYRELKKEGHK